jgi:hypothetical protein
VGILFFLVKPVLYLIAFIVGAKLFARQGAPSQWPRWLVVGLATIGRLAAGVPVGIAAMSLVANDGSAISVRFAAVIFVFGFLLWLGVAKLAFRRTPLSSLALFAAVAEAISGTIDLWAWHDAQSIRFC